MYSDENLMRLLADAERASAEGAEHTESGCGTAGEDTWGLTGYPLASVYAPLQEWREAYSEEEALHRGTLFRQLDKPFLGAGGAG